MLFNESENLRIVDEIEYLNRKINDEMNPKMHESVNRMIDFWHSKGADKAINKYREICNKNLGPRYDDIHNVTEFIRNNKIPDLVSSDLKASEVSVHYLGQ